MMRIGIVSYWFNRGQASVARYIRSIFDNAGYNTYVLARPTRERFVKPNFVAKEDVWRQERVTPASNYMIPYKEYGAWIKSNKIDLVFCDQNYQFEELTRLRKLGVVTIGRFVWESFGATHLKEAKNAFDVVYSLTRCEQERYKAFGIESPLLRWGIHPELLQYRDTPKRPQITFFYPGGYFSPRKPIGAILEAFSRVTFSDIHLIIKSQRALRNRDLVVPKTRLQTIKNRTRDDDPVLQNRSELLKDPRVSIVTEDSDSDSYYKLFSSCHVCLAPSRWEGLGLHLFEASGFGLPTITNDNPPMNEIINHNENGLLVPAFPLGSTKSGIEAYEPKIEQLAEAIADLSNKERLNSLTEKTKKLADRLVWENTVTDYLQLVTDVS